MRRDRGPDAPLFDPKRVDVKQLRKGSPWATHCMKAIRRISQVGWDCWLIEEHDRRSWDDPEWCQWTEALYRKAGSPTLESLFARF